MAFDMGFNFRATAGHVTDPAYAVPVLAESYPHTYTNANGYSINAGWDQAVSTQDGPGTNDPRIAGVNYLYQSVANFHVDLSSGSAPGAGDYSIDLAAGQYSSGHDVRFKVRDSTTVLIIKDPLATYAADHYLDATLADIVATTSWTGTPVTKTFATTDAYYEWLDLTGGAYTYSLLSHFRLTLQGGEGPPSGLLLLGAGRG